MLLLDDLIQEARKSGDRATLKVLQLVKAEFQKYLTSSKNVKLDEVQEAKILMKMKDSWIDEYQLCKNAGRDVAELECELNILTGYIPELPNEESIENYTREAVTAYKLTKDEPLSMRDMKPIMAIVKEKYPLADGKVISKIVKSIIQ